MSSNASNRSSPGISRGNLRNAPVARTPQPPRPAAPAVVVPPPAPIAPPSPWREGLQIALGVAGVLGGLILLLMVISLMSDSMAVGKHLAAAKQQRSTLICQGGRMAYGDGSLRDRLTENAYFVCTDWRTLQSVEQSEQR